MAQLKLELEQLAARIEPMDAVIHFSRPYLLQVDHVLVPVFRKVNHQRRYDRYLIGLPKKNGKSTLAACVDVCDLTRDFCTK